MTEKILLKILGVLLVAILAFSFYGWRSGSFDILLAGANYC